MLIYLLFKSLSLLRVTFKNCSTKTLNIHIFYFSVNKEVHIIKVKGPLLKLGTTNNYLLLKVIIVLLCNYLHNVP